MQNIWKLWTWYCHVWNSWYVVETQDSGHLNAPITINTVQLKYLSATILGFSPICQLGWLHCTNCFRKMPNSTGNKSSRKLSKKPEPYITAASVLVYNQSIVLCLIPVMLRHMELVQYWLTHRRMDHPSQSAYGSYSLSATEKKYSLVDCEGLAIIFSVLKFRQYLLSRQFSIIIDHKPLVHLFSPSRSIPALGLDPQQIWLYHSLQSWPEKNLDTEALSCLPLPESPVTVPLPGEYVLLLQILKHSVTAKQTKHWTLKDLTLAWVCFSGNTGGGP